jgi:hypothetical protein
VVGSLEPFLFFFFLIFLFFFFLSSWLLASKLSLGDEEEREEDTMGEEVKGLVGGLFSWGVGISYEAPGAFGITGVENNDIGNPIANHGRLNVEIQGGPTFPKEGKQKGSLRKRVPYLVYKGGWKEESWRKA